MGIHRVAIALTAVLVLLSSSAWAADWQSQLVDLIHAEPGTARDALLAEIVDAAPDWQAVADHLRALEFPPAPAGRFVQHEALCLDGAVRPWLVYVPSGYDPAVPTPLLIKLHGGVGTPNLPDDPRAEEQDSPYLPFADRYGYLVLFPYGQDGATWWDEVGMANVAQQLRDAKRSYNVDDDRVYMGGFSDGASASFCHAMVAPTDYAAFVALNGHLGVGSLDGDLPLYATNLANTPLYATTTFDDELYPSRRMRPAIEMARAAGGDVYYRELLGTHDFDFADTELPRIARFLARHPRDPLPHRIDWETALPEFGRCRWLSIDKVAFTDPAPWHEDHNAALLDEMIVIGFQPDDTFEGPGMLVGSVVEGYAADSLGLLAGDVIVQAGELEIVDGDDLWEYKSGLSRGDAVSLVVIRDGQEVTLDGQMPPPESYFVFKREQPSARARVSFSANHVDVQGSRLGAFSVYVHPDMFRLEEEIVITVDGEEVFRGMVEPDLGFMLEQYLQDRDRKLLYVAKVSVEL